MRNLPITPEQLSELVAWRVEALERMPYMASILMALRPLNAPGLGTFACDPYFRLYIDFDAVTKLGPEFCAEALLHECCHLFQHDAERAVEHGVAPRDRMTFNVAADCANNDDLIDAGCSSLAKHAMTPTVIGAPNYQTAEFYYDFLKDLEDDDEQADSDESGSGSDSGDAQSGSQESSSDGPFHGCGSAAGGESAPCELDEADDFGGNAPAATSAERKITDVAVASEIKNHAAKHPGTTPGGILERAEQVLKPAEVNWRVTLSAAVRRATATRAGDYDTTYSRRNRRQTHRAFGSGTIIQPGIESPIPRIVVVRDTSGSMSDDDLSLVTNEVEGIAKQLGVRDDNLVVLDVDTQVAATHKYRGFKDLANVAGRGGTDMCVGIESASALRPSPSAIVVITDGYTPWPAVKGRVPVVACIVGTYANDAQVINHIPSFITAVKVPQPKS